MNEIDSTTDDAERMLLATLKKLADRLPTCSQELQASEVQCRRMDISKLAILVYTARK